MNKIKLAQIVDLEAAVKFGIKKMHKPVDLIKVKNDTTGDLIPLREFRKTFGLKAFGVTAIEEDKVYKHLILHIGTEMVGGEEDDSRKDA